MPAGMVCSIVGNTRLRAPHSAHSGRVQQSERYTASVAVAWASSVATASAASTAVFSAAAGAFPVSPTATLSGRCFDVGRLTASSQSRRLREEGEGGQGCPGDASAEPNTGVGVLGSELELELRS